VRKKKKKKDEFKNEATQEIEGKKCDLFNGCAIEGLPNVKSNCR
jgi:hypothetical protein